MSFLLPLPTPPSCSHLFFKHRIKKQIKFKNNNTDAWYVCVFLATKWWGKQKSASGKVKSKAVLLEAEAKKPLSSWKVNAYFKTSQEIHCFINFTELSFYFTFFILKQNKSGPFNAHQRKYFTVYTCIFNQVMTAPCWLPTPITSF